MRRLLAAVLGTVLLLSGEAHAAKLIAVLPLDVSNTKGKLDKAGQASIEEMLRDTATNALRPQGWTILSGENTIQVLIDNGVKPEECGEQSCHLANARELKAEAFISGTVQYVDGGFIASIRLVDTKSGSLLVSERVRGKTVSELSEAFESKANGFYARAGLSPAGSTPPDADSSRPQAKKGKVADVVGSLTVTAKPKDAVRLELIDPNGNHITSGAPYENKAARPGRWKVIAKASGYEQEEKTVDIQADDAMLLKFELKTLGALSVTGEPAGSAVTVTGPAGFKDEGGLPWEASGLKSGRYVVKVSRGGYVDATETVEVTSGKTATLKVVLKKPATSETRIEPKSGLEFVHLSGGKFHAGCEAGDSDCDVAKDRGWDYTIKPFWIGKTEVTADAYARCVKAGACSKKAATVNWGAITSADRREHSRFCTYGKSGKGKHPINCVDWVDASHFCEWLGGRLPTSEQWEFAAKGGERRIRPWGNEPVSGDRANFCDDQCHKAHPDYWAIEGQNDGWAQTAPVGSYPRGASKDGVLDLVGNVAEWTSDGNGNETGTIRGGCWGTCPPMSLRSSQKFANEVEDRTAEVGMRCVLE